MAQRKNIIIALIKLLLQGVAQPNLMLSMLPLIRLMEAEVISNWERRRANVKEAEAGIAMATLPSV